MYISPTGNVYLNLHIQNVYFKIPIVKKNPRIVSVSRYVHKQVHAHYFVVQMYFIKCTKKYNVMYCTS